MRKITTLLATVLLTLGALASPAAAQPPVDDTCQGDADCERPTDLPYDPGFPSAPE